MCSRTMSGMAVETTVSARNRHAPRRPIPVWAIATAGLAVALGAGVVAGGVPLPSAAAIVALVPAAVVDARSRRLPDRLVGTAAVVLLAAVALAAAGQPVGVTGLAAGAVLLAGPLLVVHLISPAAMGFGDVKAAAVVGAAVGFRSWHLALPALAAAAAVTAGAAVVCRARTVAFGPGLVAGASAALLAASVLVPPGDPDGGLPQPAGGTTPPPVGARP